MSLSQNNKIVFCNGYVDALDVTLHPKIYLCISEDIEEKRCPYCGKIITTNNAVN